MRSAVYDGAVLIRMRGPKSVYTSGRWRAETVLITTVPKLKWGTAAPFAR